jgi:crossover junction endodeoxyribonuclease RusA
MTQIELPWPPKQLFPNFRNSHHWSASHKKVKAARMLAWGTTAQLLGAGIRSFPIPEAGRLPIRIQAEPPKRAGRPPDEDGFIGACKAYLDGLASALGVDDSKFRLAVEWLPKSGEGRVIISF